MSVAVLYKLLAIFATVAIGWVAGRMRWLGLPVGGTDPSRVVGNSAFFIFVPALLFRTTARLDMHTMPWATVAAFFVPLEVLLLAVYAWQRWRTAAHQAADVDEAERAAAVPAARAIAVCFGNSVQVGIPMAAALFGEAGLGIHVALVSLHALILLSTVTLLVELDVARARAVHEVSASLWRTMHKTLRNTVVHPVTLPVLAGLAWNATGWPVPGALDETLQLLGTAVAPVCLVLIGLSLAYTGIGGAVGSGLAIAGLKLVALPALVLAVAHWGFGLAGMPLHVVVLMAAMPTGSNALIFAQRYRAHEAEATASIVLGTVGFVLTAPAWLAVLARTS